MTTLEYTPIFLFRGLIGTEMVKSLRKMSNIGLKSLHLIIYKFKHLAEGWKQKKEKEEWRGRVMDGPAGSRR